MMTVILQIILIVTLSFSFQDFSSSFNNFVSRAEFSKLFILALHDGAGNYIYNDAQQYFEDVPGAEGAWYSPYINTAAGNGAYRHMFPDEKLYGTYDIKPKKFFYPDKPITRFEALQMINCKCSHYKVCSVFMPEQFKKTILFYQIDKLLVAYFLEYQEAKSYELTPDDWGYDPDVDKPVTLFSINVFSVILNYLHGNYDERLVASGLNAKLKISSPDKLLTKSEVNIIIKKLKKALKDAPPGPPI